MLASLGHAASQICCWSECAPTRHTVRVHAEPACAADATRVLQKQHEQHPQEQHRQTSRGRGDHHSLVLVLTLLTWSTFYIGQLYLCVEPLTGSWVRSAELWAMLCCWLFWISHCRGTAEASPSPSPEIAPEQVLSSGSSTTEIDAFIVETTKKIDVVQPPAKSEELLAQGWKDWSLPTAKIFAYCDDKRSRLTAVLDMETIHQEPIFPLVEVSADGQQVMGGAIPIFWWFGLWKQWFPFCTSAEPLLRIGPDRMIWILRFQILFISIDVVLFSTIVNRLDSEGCLDVIIASPPLGTEGQPWLGTTVPGKTATFRTEIKSVRLSLYPVTANTARIKLVCDVIDSFKIEWIHCFFWQTAAAKILSLIARSQAEFVGSDLYKRYNDSGKAGVEFRQYFHTMAQEIREHLARKQV
eukprot:gnl/TRDRNA2_/TRDRNA2_203483_c0_seq1.p1 gnl/TRDRNA2_/TRDRNA2_203483_c0~~gnl/TRDRNA2_/TRDRNA2_203483_c0_seq1.p1  ORF type:complete len:412 (+),score=35.74 gnl/TRDRNA2_/TRDRNA2_203483_c0_seq1:91-1326(+)